MHSYILRIYDKGFHHRNGGFLKNGFAVSQPRTVGTQTPDYSCNLSVGLYIDLAPLYLKYAEKLQEKRFDFIKSLASIIPENVVKVSKIKCFKPNQQTLSTTDKYFKAPYEEHTVTICGQTIIPTNGELATARLSLPKKKREIIFRYFFGRYSSPSLKSTNRNFS